MHLFSDEEEATDYASCSSAETLALLSEPNTRPRDSGHDPSRAALQRHISKSSGLELHLTDDEEDPFEDDFDFDWDDEVPAQQQKSTTTPEPDELRLPATLQQTSASQAYLQPTASQDASQSLLDFLDRPFVVPPMPPLPPPEPLSSPRLLALELDPVATASAPRASPLQHAQVKSEPEEVDPVPPHPYLYALRDCAFATAHEKRSVHPVVLLQDRPWLTSARTQTSCHRRTAQSHCPNTLPDG